MVNICLIGFFSKKEEKVGELFDTTVWHFFEKSAFFLVL